MTLPPFEPTMHLRFVNSYGNRVLEQFWTRTVGNKVESEWRGVPFVERSQANPRGQVMGMYVVKCPCCGQPHYWFSGNLDQRWSEVQDDGHGQRRWDDYIECHAARSVISRNRGEARWKLSRSALAAMCSMITKALGVRAPLKNASAWPSSATWSLSGISIMTFKPMEIVTMPGLGKMILTDTHIGKDVPDELAFPALLKRLLANSRRTESGCLEWTGWRGATGYGFTSFRGRQRPTHRLMYMVTKGPIPEGLQILHSCDNPPCMEPDHISPGTGQKNMRESVERGRHHEAVRLTAIAGTN